MKPWRVPATQAREIGLPLSFTPSQLMNRS